MTLNQLYKTYTAKYPNKYKLTPRTIKRIQVLDWDALMKKTWQNPAKKGDWWCHLEGSQEEGRPYQEEDEFWIGFNRENGKIECWWSSYEGMCDYKFKQFYDILDMENRFDLMVQVNTVKWLNQMIDDGILSKPVPPVKKDKNNDSKNTKSISE